MRTCAEYQELISALLDGELTAEEKAEVEAHIAVCEECKAMYEAFAAVSGMEAAEVPDTLHEAVMTKVTAAQKAFKTQNNLVRLRPILTTAACLVVIVGILFAVRTGFARRGASTEAPMAAPETFMKAASESPMEAAPAEAPAEPAAPAMFAAAPMAPDTEEAEEAYSYANDIAGDEPLPAPEPKAKAEPQCVVAEIAEQTAGGYSVVDTETGEVWIMRISENTQMTDEVRNALMPGCVVTVEYHTQETDEMSVIYADAIWFAE